MKHPKLLLAAMAAGAFLNLHAQPKDGNGTNKPADEDMTYVQVGKKTYHVYDYTDQMHVYKKPSEVVAKNCFIVISKKEYRIYVYEVAGRDTLLVAHYPVCYALNPENKQRVGDMKTPECSMEKPFYISQIQPASSWKHDFKDGRGSVPSYGAWFLRLVTPGHSGIGIHGSTSNEASVPGRDSEGCIRLRDNDIKHLKENYARVNTHVVIKSIKQGKLPFEKKAEQALGKNYCAPVKGYTLTAGAKFVGR